MAPKQSSLTSRSQFGAFLREKRLQHGLTQTGLGAAFGISQAAINAYEIGSAVPGAKRLFQLSLVLDFDIKDAMRLMQT